MSDNAIPEDLRQPSSDDFNESQSSILLGLRAVVGAVDELMSCDDMDTLYRRAVEFCRHELGLERCAIFVEHDGYLRGTYGTDRHGRTTDERDNRMPLTTVWSGSSWETWKARLRTHRPQDRRWVKENAAHCEWDGTKVQIIGEGWVAFTLLQSPDGGLAVLFNDTAITGAPIDETRQEIVSIFCSLLGSITRRRKPRHIYENIAQKLKNDILNHVYADKIPGERELAREYSVNFKTINKAVSQLVEEGLLYRLKGRGTFVSHAPAFPKPKKNRVGLLVSDIKSPSTARIVEALQQQIAESNIVLEIETLPDPAARIDSVIAHLNEQNARAAIVWREILQNERCREILRESEIAAVSFGQPYPDLDCVELDEFTAAKRLTAHLLETYGLPVVFVTNQSDNSPNGPRFDGYREAMEEWNRTGSEPAAVHAGRSFNGGYQAAKDIIARTNAVSVFVEDELTALGFERALTNAGAPVKMAAIVESVEMGSPLSSVAAVRFSYENTASRLLYLVERRLSFPDRDAKHLRIEPEFSHLLETVS